eukprot:TRINITY_DN34464_c0_g1_i1.p1 TRINITY_DN34464_c0_g1~~TRINITY_DN34464_c0_g1_i1.p1  ORF type:complete len:332 (+),score=62.58 TRINITY_DN34464_c0_g1_i1:36-998(+)
MPPGCWGPVANAAPPSSPQVQVGGCGCASSSSGFAGSGCGVGLGNGDRDGACHANSCNGKGAGASPHAGATAGTSRARSRASKSPARERRPRRGGRNGGAKAGAAPEERNTVMIRNLPETYTRTMLTNLLDSEGFFGTYDFVYLPTNFRTEASFGYAFVNFVTQQAAVASASHFEGFRQWGVPSERVGEVSWSDMHQGLKAHVDRYRNSPVMHDSVPDEHKPAVFMSGRRVPFPAATKRLRVPRVRRQERKCEAPGGQEGDMDEASCEEGDNAVVGGCFSGVSQGTGLVSCVDLNSYTGGCSSGFSGGCYRGTSALFPFR